VADQAQLPRRFAEHLRSEGLLQPGDRVLVGVSGGLDSVVLLHLLRFATPIDLNLHAAHLDHGLRPASVRDAQWVQGLCNAWQVPLRQARTSAPPRGEAAARTLRYQFLQQSAAELSAKWVLTAHQADDQLETLLFRVARGTGLPGIRGIPARRGNIVRPLLPFRRAELQRYAHAVRLHWREDESNRWLTLSRNRIRHRVLPALEARWPGAALRWQQLAELATTIDAAWDALLPGLIGSALVERTAGRRALARGVMQEYHPQTRARVLRELASELGTGIGRVGTRTALRFVVSGGSGSAVRLGPQLTLSREFDQLVLSRSEVGAGTVPDLPVRIDTDIGSGRACIGGAWIDVSWGPLLPAGATAAASFDHSALRFPLELRGWRPGDRIHLGYGTKKLKKLLAEWRVPRSRRNRLAILAEQAGQGGVLWVVGLVQAQPGTGDTERWHITVSYDEPG